MRSTSKNENEHCPEYSPKSTDSPGWEASPSGFSSSTHFPPHHHNSPYAAWTPQNQCRDIFDIYGFWASICVIPSILNVFFQLSLPQLPLSLKGCVPKLGPMHTCPCSSKKDQLLLSHTLATGVTVNLTHADSSLLKPKLDQDRN